MNQLDGPVFMAKPILTEFGIHQRLESCEAFSRWLYYRQQIYHSTRSYKSFRLPWARFNPITRVCKLELTFKRMHVSTYVEEVWGNFWYLWDSFTRKITLSSQCRNYPLSVYLGTKPHVTWITFTTQLPLSFVISKKIFKHSHGWNFKVKCTHRSPWDGAGIKKNENKMKSPCHKVSKGNIGHVTKTIHCLNEE